jgi:hypothetical protein
MQVHVMSNLVWSSAITEPFLELGWDSVGRGAHFQKATLLAVQSSHLQLTLLLHPDDQHYTPDAILIL